MKAIFKNWFYEQKSKALSISIAYLRPDEMYFWQTQAGEERNLLALVGGKRLGFEMKRTEALHTRKSMP